MILYKQSFLAIVLIGVSFAQAVSQPTRSTKKADKLFFEQKYTQASALYREVLETEANNEYAQYRIELCSLLVKDYRNKPLNTILAYSGSQGKKDRFYDYWLGRIYLSRYRFEEGIEALNAFLKLDTYKSPEIIDSTRHYIKKGELSIASYGDPKLYELEKVSREVDNASSQLTAVYFPPTNQLIYTDHTRPNNDITVNVISQTGDNQWSEPVLFASIGSLNNDDYDLEFLPPNRLLFKKERAIDIIPYENGQWGSATPYIVKLQVKNKHSHFTISADESIMIVSEKDFLGKYDLYESRKNGEEWSKPTFIRSINTPLDEHSPFLTDDNQYLYFSSEGHDALGGHDVFVSTRSGNTWGKPENLGHPINTFDDELYFTINSDGKSGYLSSDRMGSNGGFDLYHFREATFRDINGTITEQSTEQPVSGLRIELQSTKFPDEIFISYTNESGKYSSKVITSDIMKVKVFENEDMLLDTKLDKAYPVSDDPIKRDFTVALVDSADNVSLAKALISNENADFDKEAYADIDYIASEFRPGRKALLKDLYFEYASSEVASNSAETLDVLVMVLKDVPSLNVEIAAHTDYVGSKAFNQNLSEKRAQYVYNYLIEKGIAENRLTAKGYGESQPVGSNETDEGRALNRRIEIIVAE